MCVGMPAYVTRASRVCRIALDFYFYFVRGVDVQRRRLGHFSSDSASARDAFYHSHGPGARVCLDSDSDSDFDFDDDIVVANDFDFDFDFDASAIAHHRARLNTSSHNTHPNHSNYLRAHHRACP